MKISSSFETLLPKVQPQPGHFDNPRLHLRTLFLNALGLTQNELLFRWNLPEMTDGAFKKIEWMVEQANSGQPTQYITGEQWFWKSCFRVGPGVLIPRPETELLIEKFLAGNPNNGARVAELGAGSGNIGVSCLIERPDLQWHAWEICPNAAQYARENSLEILGHSSNYQLHSSNFRDQIFECESWDAVISNPPYIASEVIASLSPQVQREPKLALDGGTGGLEIISRLIVQASKMLTSQGVLCLEIGDDQRDLTATLLRHSGFTGIAFFQDLAGRDRVGVAKRGV